MVFRLANAGREIISNSFGIFPPVPGFSALATVLLKQLDFSPVTATLKPLMTHGWEVFAPRNTFRFNARRFPKEIARKVNPLPLNAAKTLEEDIMLRFRPGFRIINLTLFFLLASLACRGQGEDFLVGARGGISPDVGINRFQQVEAFGRWKLWHWKIYSECYLRPALDISTGSLWNQSGAGFGGTLGP